MRSAAVVLVLTGWIATGAAAQTAADTAYDNRVKSAMASATSFQGPLDGGWSLLAEMRELYVLQLNDRNGVVEGAWRDPRRPGALEASGFIEQVTRSPDGLTFHIGDRAVALHSDAEGRLTGELTEAGRPQVVTLRRRGP